MSARGVEGMSGEIGSSLAWGFCALEEEAKGALAVFSNKVAARCSWGGEGGGKMAY